jgi:peroxiredoxin
MNNKVKKILLFVGFPVLIAGNTYFYFTEKAKQFPEIDFTLIDGKKVSSGEFAGNLMLINFWATTCTPCRKEIPDLVNLHNEYSSKGFSVLGVAMSYDRPDQVIRFKQDYKIPYPLAMDIDSSIATRLNVEAIPLTLLISPRGRIGYRHSGVINVDVMRKRIEAMLSDERR